MSIASAFNNATSGLAASARAVQVVSSNIANALTEGYAARRLDLGSATLGGGVRVLGTTRLTDPVLQGLTRDAAASASAGAARNIFWQRVEGALGLPGQGLSQALSAFDSALISASDRPDLESRLATVADRATALAAQLGGAQETVQTLRLQADAAIAQDVETLNAGLGRIDDLNERIVRMQASGQSSLGLEDERAALISSLSDIVPMRELARSDGRITLFTTGGTLLLDIAPAEIGFNRTPAMDASLTNGAGLSGLTIGGRAIDTGAAGPVAGGRLAANFQIRDHDGVQVQAQIDGFARDLIARFSDPATDPSLSAGVPGLFTDAGGSPTAAPGLAGRIAVNAAILPDQGGALWRLRDGIGATTPGPVGDPSQLGRLSAALDRPVAAGPGAPALSAGQSLGELLTTVSRARQGAEETATSTQARHAELTQQSLAQGVDTDAEMQRLLLVEQAYSANARVIETADALLKRLMEI
ncbi:MAG: flagellar hook-associated protein FlgK [Rhodobacter sp.]|nr:flagellar hook-associated protein FlgK [Paracoccaceae bacterium]MCB1409481.1 flagellar hook-associated protein FlgK [Paracoccaceae bacterium]MCC0081244.1 flagellar hook-associated protein FlgK [Rhodobacter sp.]